LRIIGKIEADERIPKPLRTEVAEELAHRLDQRLFTIAVGAARRGQFDDASRAAALLRQRSPGRAARLAAAAVALCKFSSAGRFMVGLLVALRRGRQRARWGTAQARFNREFAPLLEAHP
jgi:purine nucleoside permease